MAYNQLSYLELPADDIQGLKNFYASLFGWSHRDWGPDYATVHGAGLEIGYNGSEEGRSTHPLAMIETDDVSNMEHKVVEVGGTITVPLFHYPGGRRFHFKDPSGNELAVMQPDR